jgi:uncharacterized protein YjdB
VDIRVSYKNGELFTTSYIVPKTGADVTGIKLLSLKLITLKSGAKTQLSAQVVPEDALNQNIIWSSSSSAIASVDSNGLVKALVKGTAVITATTQDGGYSEQAVIRIQ